MAHDQGWRGLVDRLNNLSGVDVVQSEIGTAVTNEDREIAKMLGAAELPQPVMEILQVANGTKLLWNGEVAGKPLQGSLNILTFLEASVRAGANEESEPLEGVLWDDEFPEDVKAQLKDMVLFEALAGRSAYLAYRQGDAKAKLHLIDGDRIAPLVPPFEVVVEQLRRYGGADGLREQLTHEDWEARLAADPQMQALVGQ